MNLRFGDFDPKVMDCVGWSLVHSLWQAVLAAMCLAVALQIMARRSANARYLASCVAVGLAALLPVFTFCWLVWSNGTGDRTSAVPETGIVAQIDSIDGAIQQIAEPTDPTVASLEPGTAERSVVQKRRRSDPPMEIGPAAPAEAYVIASLRPYLPAIVRTWLVGVFLLAVWQGVGWLRVEHVVRRRTTAVSDSLQKLCDRLAKKLSLSQSVRLLNTAWTQVPVVWGWLKPVILLPASLATDLPPEQLEAILVHELAHIRRHDFLINVLQVIVETLMFYHPAVWWMSDRLRREREFCCDDTVLEVCGDRVQYARALTTIAELGLAPMRATPAASGGRLTERIWRVLGRREPRADWRGRSVAATFLASGAALLICAGLVGVPADNQNLRAETHEAPSENAGEVPSPEGTQAARQTTEKPAIQNTNGDANAGSKQAAVPRIQILDSEGNPVSDAWVGTGAYGSSENEPSWSPYSPRGISGADGFAKISGRSLPEGSIVIYARHEKRNLVGLREFEHKELMVGAQMKLVPACRVHGTLESSTLEAADRSLDWTNVYLNMGKSRPLSFMSKENRFEFYVPPGSFRLNAYGGNTGHVNREIEVNVGQTELEVEAIDLPVLKFAKLIGKPAPELREIKEWSGSKPFTLESVRGKYVLLHFWGYWCGPCVSELPHLMMLHDAYADRGLVVLSIHDASVDSIQEMNEKLVKARERSWWGREIPFPVALDGGGTRVFEGNQRTGRGATTEAYDINMFPTSLLIDREGKIVEQITAWDANLPKKLDALLGTEGKPAAWRRRFHEIYQLPPGEVVHHIETPFINERTPFITAEYNAIGTGSVGRWPERMTLNWDGKQSQRGDTGSATLIQLLKSLADRNERDDVFDCPPELAKKKIPGDWIVAKDGSLADRLIAVEAILRRKFDDQIRIVESEIEREVMVVSGEYKFHPAVPGTNDVHLSSNNEDLDDQVGGGIGPMRQFLGSLTIITRRRYVDETTGGENLSLQWSQHPSSIIRDTTTPEEVDQFFENLSKQTSLKFERQLRKVKVWEVRDVP